MNYQRHLHCLRLGSSRSCPEIWECEYRQLIYKVKERQWTREKWGMEGRRVVSGRSPWVTAYYTAGDSGSPEWDTLQSNCIQGARELGYLHTGFWQCPAESFSRGFLCLQNFQPALWEDKMVSSCQICSQAEMQMLTTGGQAVALGAGHPDNRLWVTLPPVRVRWLSRHLQILWCFLSSKCLVLLTLDPFLCEVDALSPFECIHLECFLLCKIKLKKITV